MSRCTVVARLSLTAAAAIIVHPAVAGNAFPAAPASARHAARVIHITINGELITDLDQDPVIRGNSVLIPLNGVLDRLAATVAWQPLARTADIQRGATHIQLTAGSTQARVNGAVQEMEAAPEVLHGTLMVPLRFLTDTLGLYTIWDAAEHKVTISSTPRKGSVSASTAEGAPVSIPGGDARTKPITAPADLPPMLPIPTAAQPPVSAPSSGVPTSIGAPAAASPAVPSPSFTGAAAASVPPPPAVNSAPDSGSSTRPEFVPPSVPAPAQPTTTVQPFTGTAVDAMHGTLVSISPAGDTMQIASDTDRPQLRVSKDAIVLGRESSQSTRQEMKITDLAPGDDITARFNRQGEVSVLEVLYQEARGKVTAAAGDRLLMADGRVFNLAPGAVVSSGASASAAPSTLQTGQPVVLRINPTTGQVWRITTSVDGQPTALGNAQVTSVAVETDGPCRAGDEVPVVLRGTPGGQASVLIPGVNAPLALQETEPGVYRGTFIAPVGLSVNQSSVTGRLSVGDSTSEPVDSPRTLTVDSSPPSVAQMSPAAGSTITDRSSAIYAVLQDRGLGVDPASVHMTLNGVDVTPHCQVTDRFISCSGVQLLDGVNHAEVQMRDRAGNFTVAPWQFSVESTDNQIHAVAVNVHDASRGRRLQVVLEGEAGGEATFDLGTQWLAQPMRELKPGRYEGTLTLDRGDRAAELPVIGHLRVRDRLYDRLSTDTITFDSTVPEPPVLESPIAGSKIQAPLVVSGRAQSGGRVRVKVEYGNRILSLLGRRGLSSEVIVPVDDRGFWRTGPLSLETISHDKHVVYRIVCESVTPSGVSSKATAVTVFRDVR